MAHHHHAPGHDGHGQGHEGHGDGGHGPGHGHDHEQIDWAEMAPLLEAQAELFTPCTSMPSPGWRRRSPNRG